MPKLNVITIDRTLLGKINCLKSSSLDIFLDKSSSIESFPKVKSSVFPEKSIPFDNWRSYIKQQCDSLTTTFSVENVYTDSIVVENITLLK
jgi:hypothetical protein